MTFPLSKGVGISFHSSISCINSGVSRERALLR